MHLLDSRIRRKTLMENGVTKNKKSETQRKVKKLEQNIVFTFEHREKNQIQEMQI